MSALEHKSALDGEIEFHRARLAALDNWNIVQEALAGDNPVRTISRVLGVTNLGAHSVIAMLRGRRPERAEVERQVETLEQLRVAAEAHSGVRRRRTLARCGARHVLV